MNTVRFFSEIFKPNKKRQNSPSVRQLSSLESKAVLKIHNQPRLPDNEIVAEQMIKKVNFKTKVKAVIYSLFWMISVPTIPAGLASFISFLNGCDIVVTTAWFFVVFAPLFFFCGIMGNAQKRLYVAYCLGFRGAKAALVLGWDGYEYAPNLGPYPDYFTQRYRLKMFRRH